MKQCRPFNNIFVNIDNCTSFVIGKTQKINGMVNNARYFVVTLCNFLPCFQTNIFFCGYPFQWLNIFFQFEITRLMIHILHWFEVTKWDIYFLPFFNNIWIQDFIFYFSVNRMVESKKHWYILNGLPHCNDGHYFVPPLYVYKYLVQC